MIDALILHLNQRLSYFQVSVDELAAMVFILLMLLIFWPRK